MPSFLTSWLFKPKTGYLMIENGDQKDDDKEMSDLLFGDFVTRVFNLVDKNGDGHITKLELVKAARNHTSPEIVMLKKLLGLPESIKQEDGMHELVAIFHTIDKDDNGSIELNELKAFILNLRAKKNGDSSKFDVLSATLSISLVGLAVAAAFVLLRK